MQTSHAGLRDEGTVSGLGTRTCLDSGNIGETGLARTEHAKSPGNQDPLTALFKAPLVIGIGLCCI